MGGARFTVVVPVKRLHQAKSRLRGALPGVPHGDLVLAIVLDTVAAALACPAVAGVVLVTDSATVTAAGQALGALVRPDPPGGGLNAALRHGAAGTRGPVAALAADLPALRPDDLAEALAAALAAVVGFGAGGAASHPGVRRCFVADTGGAGTTLLTATGGAALDPRFGPGSAAGHAASGAVALAGDWPSLRRDVDTAADLSAAIGLGLGVRTAALLRRPG